MLQPSCCNQIRDDRQTTISRRKNNLLITTADNEFISFNSNNGLDDLSNDHHKFHLITTANNNSNKPTMIDDLSRETAATSCSASRNGQQSIHYSRKCHEILERRKRQRLLLQSTDDRPLNSSITNYYSPIVSKKNNFVFTFTEAPFICSNFIKLSLLLISLISLITPTLSSINSYQNEFMMHDNKNSGQFQISQLCSPRSPFPVTRRVEGAILSSTAADTDTNCTITFRTKSSHQHFVIRFEELKLGCDDHLVLFDGDLYYGQPSIKDFSCRDNMASVPIIKTTGTFLTMRYSSDSMSKQGDGFRLVVTAVFDISMSNCPPEYAFCRSQLCISKSLFCDGINHCLDNSDEIGCNGPDDSIELPYALGFFVILVLVISIGVITCILLHCRRDNPYAQYQHQLQRAFGVPMQTSSSLMFANQQPQYQFFQPANMSPYVTPQHHAMIATLPRGYSTLPLNLLRQQQQHAQQFHQQHPQTILAKPNNMAAEMNGEYLMMTGLSGHHAQNTSTVAAIQAAQATAFQSNLTSMPNSQSILSTTTGSRYTHASQRDRGCNGGPGIGGSAGG